MNALEQNTVAAISTPYGRGGVALIRISGDDAFGVADRMFVTRSGKLPSELPVNRMTYGEIVLGGEKIDDGMIVLFGAPHSYTGENTVEITCHGGVLVSQKVLTAAFEAGASPAGAGEFTKRAFMNGRLSLSAAEAVINIIDAQTSASLKLARSHIDGALTKKLDGIYSKLLAVVSQAYVFADYPDEDLTDLTPEQMTASLREIEGELDALYNTYSKGRAINEGIYVSIVGRANAGKSSLLNLISGKERAIVSSIEGTTRDFIEESVCVGDILLKLCDTAGIRQSADVIEQIGIRRSFEAMEKADLVLAVFDGASKATDDDRELLERLKGLPQKKIAIINKCDLEECFDADLDLFDSVIRMSTLDGTGQSSLTETIKELFIGGEIDYDRSTLLVNARQASAVKNARDAVTRAIGALDSGYTQDIAGLDIEQAMICLGETDGRQVGIDIVDRIFHNFCVGK